MEKTHDSTQDTDAESDGQNTLLTIEDGISQTEPSHAESESQSISHEPSRHLSSIEGLNAEPESQSVSISIQALEPESHAEPRREPESHQEPSQSQTQSQEPQESKTEPQQKEPESQNISISPSIAEIERFISFMNTKFNIKPSNNLIVLIQKTEPFIKGYYSPNSWGVFKHQDAENLEPKKNINEITLSSLNLIFEPYETIAHEYAHFLNTYLDNYEGNGRNYHTRQFKARAEQLLLRVEKGNYGYNQTYETDAFKEMIKEFKPSEDAFKIFQPQIDGRIVGIDGNGKPRDKDGNIIKPEPKGKSRLILYECNCKCKIRTARNENKPLKALCLLCNTEFKEVIKADAKPEPSPTEPTPEPEQDKPTLSPEPEPRAEPERPEDESNHREQEVDFYCLNAEVLK